MKSMCSSPWAFRLPRQAHRLRIPQARVTIFAKPQAVARRLRLSERWSQFFRIHTLLTKGQQNRGSNGLTGFAWTLP